MRLALVHHDPAAAARLRHGLAGDARFALGWVARDAGDALARCAIDRPALLLVQLELPGCDVAAFVRQLAGATPCPVLLLCDGVHAASSRAPYAALAAGALDAVDAGAAHAPFKGSKLAEKLVQLHRLLEERPVAGHPAGPVPGARRDLVVIGASTGGPAVVAALLGALPAPYSRPCVVVQHIDPEFAPGMASWLQTQCGHRVVLVRDGDVPTPGTVHMSGGAGHLVLDAAGRFAYRREPVDSPYQPSIDEFFRSVAHWPSRGTAVLLTGMGRDGARGLAALRARGWSTVAQSPASCAVAAMPRAAIELHAAQHVFDPREIAQFLSDSTENMEKASPP